MPGIKQTNKDLLIAQPTVVNALGQPIMENNEVKFIYKKEFMENFFMN